MGQAKRKEGGEVKHRSGWYYTQTKRLKIHFFDNNQDVSLCGGFIWQLDLGRLVEGTRIGVNKMCQHCLRMVRQGTAKGI